MKPAGFFSLFTLLLIVGLVVIFTLPYAKGVVAQIPGVTLGSTEDKTKPPGATVEADTPTPNAGSPTQTPPDEDIDSKAAALYSVSLPIMIGTYVAQTDTQITSASIWSDFTGTLSDEFKDPYTNQFAVYTTQTPKRGEIQIISPGKCNSDTAALQSNTIRNTYAYRVVIGDTFLCHYNLGGSVYSR